MSVDIVLGSHRAACKRLLGRIYFQLEQVKILYNTVASTHSVNPFALLVDDEVLPELEVIKKLFVEISGCYEQADDRVLTAMMQKLESHLPELQRMQNTLAVTLQLFAEQKEFANDEDSATVFEPFTTVQDEVTRVRRFNQDLIISAWEGKPITDFVLEWYRSQDRSLTSEAEAFEKKIADVKGDLVAANIRDEFLANFFADELTEALQQQLRILLLYRWQKEVTDKGDAIIKKYPEQNLQQGLKLQQLLKNYKLQFYKAYFESKDRNQAARDALFERVVLAATHRSATTGERTQISPQQIFTQLGVEEWGASDMTNKLEGDYRKYTLFQKAMIDVAMIFTATIYYEISDALLGAYEELTDENTGIYPCKTKLDDDIFGISAAVGAVGLAGEASYLSRRTGNGSLVGLGIEALRSSLDSCIFYWGNMLGCNSERLVQALPKTRKVIGLATVAGICTLTCGITAPEATYIIGAYVIGTTAKDVSKLLLSKRPDKSDSTTLRTLKKASPLINCLVGFGSVYSACTLWGVGSLTNYVLCSYLASDTCQEAVTLAAQRMQPRLTRLMHRAFDTENLLKALPAINWLSGLSIAVGGSAMVVGITSPYTRDVAFCYLVGSVCQELCSGALDYTKKRVANSDWLQKKFSGVTKKLSKGSKQQLGRCFEILLCVPKQVVFILGSNYLAPKVQTFAKRTYNRLFHPILTREESLQLVTDQQGCLADTVECKRAAYTLLKLPEDTSLGSAEKEYRKLMLNVHPDLIGGSGEEAAEYNAAIVVLRGLNDT